ncbi:uncharacterized protein LOC126739204 [Anthonomus grandis grandis]|uniref:uncharacterized protein LOC126739204 n=1 Tax=Anthonomus grandis grandis TaxID=2921223 RepID=UPI00216692B5|nr:uncharacterized protein LOC126739204 [Anthonomus grandis grandis]XP_050300736.1 uncharacterized protein LOC126739204 [Anthonomus grandis grandis]
MGQCASNKAKGNLSVKKILSHKKAKKMEKHKHLKEVRNETNKTKPAALGGQENGRLIDPNKKPTQKYTKGVAMSFGFKKRPTPMTSHTSVAWEAEPSKPDANGNREEAPPQQISRHQILEKNMHKMASSQKPATSSIIPSKPPRLHNFPPSNPDHRSMSSSDIKYTATPIKIATPALIQGLSRMSPTTDMVPTPPSDPACCRTFTRTVTVVTQSHVTEKDELVRDPAGIQNIQPLKTGKFTFQTTKLPQPESVRVVETKAAKTIANNNRKSARLFRRYEEEHCKNYQDDSGFGSNSSGVQAEMESGPSNIALTNNKSEDRLKNSIRFSRLESSDSFSEACTPPPLPELPSAFGFDNSYNTNPDDENIEYNSRNALFQGNRTCTFLKSRNRNLLDSPSSSDPEWLNGGEAMAEEITFTPSPKRKVPEVSPVVEFKSEAIAEVCTQNLQPTLSLEMIDSLKDSLHLSVSYDGNFGDTNKYTAILLDDEILSPVESLLSSSEADDISKKRPASSYSSHSKDVNEKATPSPPRSPTRTYSLSLSDDKEDFLIDDEIADQPELLFEDGHHIDRVALSHAIEQELLSVSNPRRTSSNSEFSPLPTRRRRNLPQSTDQGSFDSLSPCDSIGSEDLMMDFDVSQSNDTDVWERQSTSVTSTDGIPKYKSRPDENTFNNKNFLKSLSSRNSIISNGTPTSQTNSPRSVRRLNRRPSTECKSPRKHPINFSGYQSMTYDPASESVTLTRTNHSAIQQDIIGIKTMLVTLKRVLNDSESHSLRPCINDIPDHKINNNNHSEFSLEMADLRRQILFLQGQLEDKEKTVSTLQKQIIDLATQSNHNSLDNATVLTVDTQNGSCNAATQTERLRPLSTGLFSSTSSPMEDNNPILRLIVK